VAIEELYIRNRLQSLPQPAFKKWSARIVLARVTVSQRAGAAKLVAAHRDVDPGQVAIVPDGNTAGDELVEKTGEQLVQDS
jgi:phage baseplate assembly protein W